MHRQWVCSVKCGWLAMTSLHDFYGLWHLYICRSLFGHSTFFVASLVFMKGASCCVKRRNFKWNWAVRSCYDKVLQVLHDFCWYLHVASWSWHLCNLSCVYALFWLVFIASYACKPPNICFQGTKYESNHEDIVYFHSTLWRRARLWLELFASTVIDSHHEYHICPHTFFFGDAVAFLWSR